MSKRIQLQNKFGDALFERIKRNGWQKDLGNPEIYGFKKKIDKFTWGVSFNFSGKNNYSIYSTQYISFDDYPVLLKEYLGDAIDQINPLAVGIVARNIDLSNLKISNSSDLIQESSCFYEKIKEQEELFFKQNSDENRVLEKNMSPFHWKWPSQPYIQFVLFMVGYGLKNGDFSKISHANEQVKKISGKFQALPGELECVEKIFNKLVENGLLR